jgi:L-fuculose-phosphate aldolase
MLATGPSLEKAMWSAIELETIARQYYHTLLIGGPVLLPADEAEDVARGFGTYGHQSTKTGASARQA